MFFDTRTSSIKKSIVKGNAACRAAVMVAFMLLIEKTKNELRFKVGYNF